MNYTACLAVCQVWTRACSCLWVLDSGKSWSSVALFVLVLKVSVEHKGFSCRTVTEEAVHIGFSSLADRISHFSTHGVTYTRWLSPACPPELCSKVCSKGASFLHWDHPQWDISQLQPAHRTGAAVARSPVKAGRMVWLHKAQMKELKKFSWLFSYQSFHWAIIEVQHHLHHLDSFKEMRLLYNKTRGQLSVSAAQHFKLHACLFWAMLIWDACAICSKQSDSVDIIYKGEQTSETYQGVPKVLKRGFRNTSLFCILPNICFWTSSEEIVIPIRVLLCWNEEFFRNFSLMLALADKILAMPKTTSLGICCSWAQRHHTLSTAVHNKWIAPADR